MTYSKEEKKKILKSHSPKSHFIKNGLLAFIFGGIVTAIGEILYLTFRNFNIEESDSRIYVSLVLITFASLMTAFSVFDELCKVGKAGFLLPITGFANGVVSEAIDAKKEGFILGVGAKIFTVAGPVILFALSSSIIYGLILYISTIL